MQIISGRQVECKKNYGREYNNQDLGQTLKCKLYIGNLDQEFTNEDLNACFGVYGKVKHAYLIFDTEKQVSKGFGYVHYETEKSAQRAINIENSKPNNSIVVKKFDPQFKTEKKSAVKKPKSEKGSTVNLESLPNLTELFNKPSEDGHLLNKTKINGNKDAIQKNHSSLKKNPDR